MKFLTPGLCLLALGSGCGKSHKKKNTANLPPLATTTQPAPQPILIPSPAVTPAVVILDQEIRHVGGQLSIGGYGRYGNIREPGSENWPGARRNAMRWTDLQGRFWLFGGDGLSENSSGRLNDLWVFDKTTAQWTWMGGGKKPDTANFADFPGARAGGSVWTGADGRLWLFGGFTQTTSSHVAYSQDLWSFDPVLGKWTWISEQPHASKTGFPAGRERAAYWVDRAGRFWLFGGQRRDLSNGSILRLNDLWFYDADQNTWTSVSPEGARPGARENAASWVDDEGKFWIFGGYGYDLDSKIGHLNDLWTFDPATRSWEFVSGVLNVDGQGIWGIRGTGDREKIPSARESMLSWIHQGKLCFFGGWGYSVYHFEGEPNALQDVWCFDVLQRQWTWLLGNNHGKERIEVRVSGQATGSVGFPGARYGAVAWVDTQNDLFIFGGAGYDSLGRGDLLQDLWRIPLQ